MSSVKYIYNRFQLVVTYILPLDLGRTTEDLIPPADAGPNLVVLRLRVAEGVELRQGSHERSTKPHSVAGTNSNINAMGRGRWMEDVPLSLVRDNLDVNTR